MASSFSTPSEPSDEDDVSQSPQRLSRGRSGGRSRGRARGFRVRGRGRGRGTRAAASSAEHSDRVEQYRRDRLAATQRLLDDMTVEDLRRLASQLVERQPGLIFDLLLQQSNSSVSEAAGVPGTPWCTCGLCREMPTDRERICCGQTPANCISKLPHFTQYCLDEGYLRIHRHYREDVTALGHATEPGDDNRQYRYAAYRHFILWKHGSLGAGNRRVIPSCCVWAIREKFPDPHRQYTGFVPGI